MALTVFLFKVLNLDISRTTRLDPPGDNEESIDSSMPTTQFIPDENTIFLTAKVIFRGINVPSFLFC